MKRLRRGDDRSFAVVGCVMAQESWCHSDHRGLENPAVGCASAEGVLTSDLRDSSAVDVELNIPRTRDIYSRKPRENPSRANTRRVPPAEVTQLPRSRPGLKLAKRLEDARYLLVDLPDRPVVAKAIIGRAGRLWPLRNRVFTGGSGVFFCLRQGGLVDPFHHSSSSWRARSA